MPITLDLHTGGAQSKVELLVAGDFSAERVQEKELSRHFIHDRPETAWLLRRSRLLVHLGDRPCR